MHSSGARTGRWTVEFVDAWLDISLDPERRAKVAADVAVQEMITQRERQLKGARARLLNKRARENWSGAAGTRPLVYRWNIASRMLEDIYDGLARVA